LAPAAAKASAVSRPIPLDAPVTSTVRSRNVLATRPVGRVEGELLPSSLDGFRLDVLIGGTSQCGPAD